MAATLALFPLTIFCGWLSDRIGRRPVLLAGLLIGVVSILPVFQGLLHFGNPALERFHDTVKVELRGSGCDYSPFRKAATDCEKVQELFAKKGVNYTLTTGNALTLKVGADEATALQGGRAKDALLAVADGDTATTPDLAAVERALIAAGWPEQADPARVDRLMLVLLLLIPVVAVAAITGPQTATLAELFPARTRYSAVALPHNLSAGWIGGLSPFMVTLLSVQSGNALAGLWYPVALLGMASVVGLLFLPETRNAPLDR
jgi:MFS family permease